MIGELHEGGPAIWSQGWETWKKDIFFRILRHLSKGRGTSPTLSTLINHSALHDRRNVANKEALDMLAQVMAFPIDPCSADDSFASCESKYQHVLEINTNRDTRL
jgi:hypothetical protein